MRIDLSGCVVAFLLLHAGFVFAGGTKSRVITTSPLTITVPDDRFLKITNFTQEGGTERAVVRANVGGDSAGSANVLAAVRIDLSTGVNSQSFPEIDNRVVIAGPAEVTVVPVPGATLFITYEKDLNESGGEQTPTPGVFSPTPAASATPSGTPSVTPIPSIAPVLSPIP